MIQQSRAAATAALFISLGAFLLSCPVVLWDAGLFALVSADVGLQVAVVDGMSATMIVVSMGFALWSLGRGLVGLPAPLVVGAAAVYVAALGGYAALQTFEPGSAETVSAFLLGAALGVGLAFVVPAWCGLVAPFGLRSSLVGLGVSCGTSSLVGLGFSVGLLSCAPVALVGCALLGVAAPVVQALRGSAGLSPDVVEGVETRHVWDSMRTMILNPCLGLCLFVFVMSARGFVFMGYRHIGAESVVVAAVIVVALARWWPRFSLSTVYRVFLPAVAALFIVLSSFPITNAFFATGYVVSHGAMAVIALLALASLCAVAQAGEFSPVVVGGALAAMVGLAALLGFNLRFLVSDADSVGAALLVCSMAYFTYVLVSPLVDYHRILKDYESGDDGVPASAPRASRSAGEASSDGFDREAACLRLADEHGLSAREREILSYVARGHRPAYVGDVLCISEHTVRTHIRNMYRKLGVGSHEELIQLVESCGDRPAAG